MNRFKPDRIEAGRKVPARGAALWPVWNPERLEEYSRARPFPLRVGLGLALWLLVGLFAAGGAGAESARSLAAQGNNLYEAGKYDEALQAYEQAATERPESGEILFDKGNAYFRKGETDKAKEAYQAAAAHTKDPKLEAKAHFNLGNTAYAEAEKLLSNDPKQALNRLGESVQSYRDALRIDPGLQEAGRNIEITRLKMKDALDRIKKQEEEAKERQRQQEALQKALKEAIEEQQSEAKQTDALKEKEEKAADPSTSPDIRSESEKLASNQSATRDKVGKISEDLKATQPPPQPPQSPQPQSSQQTPPSQPQQAQSPAQQNPPPGQAAQEDPARAAADKLDQAVQSQDSAVDKLKGGEFDEAKGHQEKALERMKEALDQMSGSKQEGSKGEQKPGQQSGQQNQAKGSGEKDDQPQGSEPQDEQKESQPSEKPGAEQKPSKAGQKQSEAKKDQAQSEASKGSEGKGEASVSALQEQANDILREEKEHRLQLQRSVTGGAQAVDKDW